MADETLPPGTHLIEIVEQPGNKLGPKSGQRREPVRHNESVFIKGAQGLRISFDGEVPFVGRQVSYNQVLKVPADQKPGVYPYSCTLERPGQPPLHTDGGGEIEILDVQG